MKVVVRGMERGGDDVTITRVGVGEAIELFDSYGKILFRLKLTDSDSLEIKFPPEAFMSPALFAQLHEDEADS